MQPLYLDGPHPIEVDWAEPALAITRRHQSTRLVPVRLVSHILASGHDILWHQAALSACAEADIPIFFTNGAQELRAVLRGNTREPTQDWYRLVRLIEQPDGLDHYHTFLLGKRTQLQRDLTPRWTPQPKMQIRGYPRAARTIRNALRADLEAELHRRGFRQRISALRDAGIDLPADLAQILEPYVHWVLNETYKPAVLQSPPGALVETPTRRQVIAYYEHCGETVRDVIRALVISLLIWLAEADTDNRIQPR
ncbi:MAG: CRISPR-associated endonuclease Cas1 [Thiotrichales bacterium]